MAKRRANGEGSIRKKQNGLWEGRIVVGHKENGLPLYRYIYGKTQKELLDKLHRSRELYQGAELTEDSRMTLGEWLDRWLTEYASVSVRSSTLAGYRRYAEHYIKPFLGEKVISKLTTEDIQQLYRKLKKNGRVNEHAELGRQLSDGTIRHVHSMLHLAMEDAVHARMIPVNPTNGTTVPKSRRQAKRILNDEELERFMAECRKDAIWHDFFYVELTTGLRRGEICGLMWQDFDEAKGTLMIARTLYCTKIGDYTTGDTKTGKGTRTITLPPSTAQLLRKRKLTALSVWIFPDPLRPEYPIVPSSAYSWMKKLLETAGLLSIRFHDLRHTFATTSLEYGMDVKTLSTIIGHNSVATTLNIYAHITDDMRAKAAASIDRGIAKQEQIIPPVRKPASENMAVFTAVKGQRRKQGTGCVSQFGDHLWEGKYSPRGPDGKKRSGNVYAHTREECEEKLKTLIQKMKAELAAERERARQTS